MEELYLIKGKTLRGIANAIRSQKGTEEQLDPAYYEEEILSIQSGGGEGIIVANTESEMDAILTQENVDKIVKYIGESGLSNTPISVGDELNMLYFDTKADIPLSFFEGLDYSVQGLLCPFLTTTDDPGSSLIDNLIFGAYKYGNLTDDDGQQLYLLMSPLVGNGFWYISGDVGRGTSDYLPKGWLYQGVSNEDGTFGPFDSFTVGSVPYQDLWGAYVSKEPIVSSEKYRNNSIYVIKDDSGEIVAKQLNITSGTLNIAKNGTYNVVNKETVEVATRVPEGTFSITSNGTYYVDYKEKVEVNVPSKKAAMLIGAPDTYIESFELTENDMSQVSKIRAYACTDCTLLAGISAPNATSVGDRAFSGCTNLHKVILPQVTTIGWESFTKCNIYQFSMPLLEQIGERAFDEANIGPDLDLPNLLEIGDNAFWMANVNQIIAPKLTTVGEHCFEKGSLYALYAPNLANIGSICFAETNINEANYPLVEKLSDAAFQSCYNLVTADFRNATEIGSGAFYYCRSLSSVNISKAVTIGRNAFNACTNISEITIPASCTSIDYGALRCGGQTAKCTFVFEGQTPPTIKLYSEIAAGEDTFNKYTIEKIIVPVGCGETYKTATNWTTVADYIEEATE